MISSLLDPGNAASDFPLRDGLSELRRVVFHHVMSDTVALRLAAA